MNHDEFAKKVTALIVGFQTRIGDCDTCEFQDSDGEQGEIEICNHEWNDDLPIIEGLGTKLRCPFWKGRQAFCIEHQELVLNDEGNAGCGVCLDSYIKEMQAKGEL